MFICLAKDLVYICWQRMLKTEEKNVWQERLQLSLCIFKLKVVDHQSTVYQQVIGIQGSIVCNIHKGTLY